MGPMVWELEGPGPIRKSSRSDVLMGGIMGFPLIGLLRDGRRSVNRRVGTLDGVAP
jgi:hypothetical protein